jgi:hypothetical protein
MKKLILAIVTFSVGVLVEVPARADIVEAQPGIPPRFNVMDSTPPLGRYMKPKAMKSVRHQPKKAVKGFRLSKGFGLKKR